MKKLLLLCSALALCCACNNRWKSMEEGFRTPPDSIRTAVYWYWLDNYISKECEETAARLSRHVLGIEPVEAGFGKVRIEPHLGNLDLAEGSFPTPYGVITVRHEKQADGSVKSQVKLPKGVKRVR